MAYTHTERQNDAAHKSNRSFSCQYYTERHCAFIVIMEQTGIIFLISEVQKRAVLWQDSHKDFKNRQVTDKVWNEVGQKCNCSGAFAKSKWKNLKDTYRKTLQRLFTLETACGKTTEQVKWPYFEPMSFIKDMVRPEMRPGNLLMPEFYSCEQEEENGTEQFEVNFIEGSCSSNMSIPKITSTHSKKDPENRELYEKQKRKRSNLLDINKQILEVEKERLQLLMQKRNNESAECSDMQFFKSLLPFMKKFSETEKLEVRGDIQKVILSKLQSTQQEHPIEELEHEYLVDIKVEESNYT